MSKMMVEPNAKSVTGADEGIPGHMIIMELEKAWSLVHEADMRLAELGEASDLIHGAQIRLLFCTWALKNNEEEG